MYTPRGMPTINPKKNFWSKAVELAGRTPDSRNRYVDFLRAASIGSVIIGHWLVAAPFMEGGVLSASKLLEHQTWTQWLTWIFQVMPLFFIVGGYSNFASWRAAKRAKRSYNEWLSSRLQRLVGPVLPLLIVWTLICICAHALKVNPDLVIIGSKVALIPIWFLAVYIMVVVFVPATHAVWERFGLASFWILVLATALDDILFFATDIQVTGYPNYVFIWLAVHQLGYAWRDERLVGLRKTLPLAFSGLLVLIGLVKLGPYPISMITVPGEGISNSFPPKLPLLALGIFQCGFLLSIEAPMRRWLKRKVPWTITILVNSSIMTIFLWHLSAMILILGISLSIGGFGITMEPGSGIWWAVRPVWIAVLTVTLLFFRSLFGRFERSQTRTPPIDTWRLVAGAILVCIGLALLALKGVGGGNLFGIRVSLLILTFVGAALAGVIPIGKASRTVMKRKELR